MLSLAPPVNIYLGVPHKSPTKVKLLLRSEQILYNTTVPKFTRDFYGTPNPLMIEIQEIFSVARKCICKFCVKLQHFLVDRK